MDPNIEAYAAARRQVEAAETAYVIARDDPKTDETSAGEALDEAHGALLAAEQPVAEAVQAVWRANFAAVQAAKAAVTAAMRERTRVENEVGNAARARNPAYPLLNDAELTRASEAAAVYHQAVAELVAAKAQFKDGVTGEQLEAVGNAVR